jgi:hypothetical protein
MEKVDFEKVKAALLQIENERKLAHEKMLQEVQKQNAAERSRLKEAEIAAMALEADNKMAEEESKRLFEREQSAIKSGPHRMKNGVAVAMSADEIAEREAEESAWLDEQSKRDESEIIAKIEVLEAKSLRAMREAIISGEKTKLLEIDAKISELKAKIKRG